MNGIGGIGGWELLLVAVIAMLVLGPEHMVRHAYQLGRWVRRLSLYWQEGVTAFREQLKDIEEDVTDASADLPNLAELKEMAAEIRLDEDLTGGVSSQGKPDATMQSEHVNAESSTLHESQTDAQSPKSYSAWRPQEK